MRLHSDPTILVICAYSKIQLAMRKKVVGSVEVCVGKKLRLLTNQSIISDTFLLSNLSDNFLRMIGQYEENRFDLAAETQSLRQLDHPSPTHGLNGESVVTELYLTHRNFPMGTIDRGQESKKTTARFLGRQRGRDQEGDFTNIRSDP